MRNFKMHKELLCMLICILFTGTFAGCGSVLQLLKTNRNSDAVGYTNQGAVDVSNMTELAFERIHYGAAVILYEDRFVFSNPKGYEFPRYIENAEDWVTLQLKLNLDLGEVDFDEYVVWGEFYFNLWEKNWCVPVFIHELWYSDTLLYIGWNNSEGRKFVAENEEDRLCGFDLVKIKRDEFPLESRSVFGAAHNDGERSDETISVENGGNCLLY